MTVTVTLKLVIADVLKPVAYLSEQLTQRGQKFWSFTRLRAQLPTVDSSVVVLGMPELHGSRNILLGRNLYLYRELYLETQAQGIIRIGNDVVLSRGVHLVSFASIEIGDGSMIGEYTSLRDANHRFGPDIAPRHAGHDARAIRIGRHVWIGRGVTILPGVTIGDGAVIGANAVVTRDVVAGSIVGGVPAKPLNRGICQ